MNSKANMKLKGMRVERGLNQDDMAALLGVTRATYAKKEQGKSQFNASEMIKIAEKLEVEPSSIFFSQ